MVKKQKGERKMTAVLLIGLFVSIMLSGIMAVTGTRIGKRGRKNIIQRCVVNVICAALIIAFSFVWGKGNGYIKEGGICAAAAAAVGVILMVCGIVEIKKTLGETENDLITEELSEVRVIHIAGINNKILEGTAGGEKRRFAMFGADKDLAKLIRKKGIKQITVTYHASDNRIEAIHY